MDELSTKVVLVLDVGEETLECTSDCVNFVAQKLLSWLFTFSFLLHTEVELITIFARYCFSIFIHMMIYISLKFVMCLLSGQSFFCICTIYVTI